MTFRAFAMQAKILIIAEPEIRTGENKLKSNFRLWKQNSQNFWN